LFKLFNQHSFNPAKLF